eukprot:Gb_21150 [translate_table: standard]
MNLLHQTGCRSNNTNIVTSATTSASSAITPPPSDPSSCCPYQSWPRRSCPCCGGRGWVCDPPAFQRPYTALGFFAAPPANHCQTQSTDQSPSNFCCLSHSCVMRTEVSQVSGCSCHHNHNHNHNHNQGNCSQKHMQYNSNCCGMLEGHENMQYCLSCGDHKVNNKPHSVSVQTSPPEDTEVSIDKINNMMQSVSVEELRPMTAAVVDAIENLKKHAREHPSRLRPAMIIHPMPMEIHRLLKPFDRKKFGSWQGPFPGEGEVFKHWGRHYMIAESRSVPKAGRGLFILDFARKGDVLMSYAGPEYDEQTWELLCCIPRIQMYGMFANMPSIRERTKKGELVDASDRVYIDGRPEEYGNIAALTNSSNQIPSLTNCSFEEATGHVVQYMPKPVKMYIAFVATRDLFPGNELFVNYEF